jgi:isoquinoline 1-oxidoreductase subunit beta
MTSSLSNAPDEGERVDESPALGRRRFLTCLVTAPVLTVAAQAVAGVAAPGTAEALPSLPGLNDVVDLGDALILAGLPTSHLLSLQITEGNRAVLQLPRVEVGQGLTTAVAMMVAEELDARLEDVDVPLSDARPELLFNQLTAASNSVRSLYGPVRAVAAAARARLVTAAAQAWGLPAGSLVTRDGSVIAPDGRAATYGSLSAAAAQVLLPAVSAAPRPAAQHKVIGTPRTRLDARDLVTGKARYALDLDVPGAMPAVVARPPTLGGRALAVNDAAARAMPGVLAVVSIPSGVAVVAETFHHALRAREALAIAWADGPVADLSDDDIRDELRSAVLPFLAPPLLTGHVDGAFDFAFVSHAPMEVQSAVADVRPDGAEVWSALKSPIVAQQTIAASVGLPVHKVKVHVVRGGGSFGRRLFFDAALEAAQISKAAGRAVKLMWSRDDDMKHGRMRPASHHKIRATFLLGSVLTYEHRVAAVRTDFRHGLGEALTAAGFDLLALGVSETFLQLTVKLPYHFGVATQLLSEVPLEVPTASWRSVYSSMVHAADEIMVDEIAKKLGKDPVAFRRATLKTAAARAVLDKAAAAGQWGRAMPPGFAQGFAFHEEYKSSVACLVELDARDPANPRVVKAMVAADVGRPINPRGLEAQLMGAAVDGLSIMLQAGNHIDGGAVRESSFSDFRYARQRHTPTEFEVHVLPANGEPGGAGELGVPAAAGAVANAYARATGTSPRRFPINF